MDYAAALAYLDTFVNFERQPLGPGVKAVITLDRVRELAARLGNPQDCFPQPARRGHERQRLHLRLRRGHPQRRGAEGRPLHFAPSAGRARTHPHQRRADSPKRISRGC